MKQLFSWDRFARYGGGAVLVVDAVAGAESISVIFSVNISMLPWGFMALQNALCNI